MTNGKLSKILLDSETHKNQTQKHKHKHQ